LQLKSHGKKRLFANSLLRAKKGRENGQNCKEKLVLKGNTDKQYCISCNHMGLATTKIKGGRT